MRLIVAALMVLILNSSSAHAGERSTGVGLTLGSPNGLTGRTWVTEENSFDYGFGWGGFSSRKFQVYTDYLWNRSAAFEVKQENFDFFFGGGLSLRTHSGTADNDLVFGPRIPVGVSYEFTHPDLELFAVFAVNVGIVPSSDVYADIHLGARFYIF